MDVAIEPFETLPEIPAFMMADAAERRHQSSPPPRRTAPRAPATPEDGHRGRPPIELVLYVSSISPHSTAALRNLKRALAKYAGSSVSLTVHDLSKDPERADRDRVHFTPMLVTRGNGPRTSIVGHLGNPQVLQALLDAALEPQE
jgi:hypothetical protein